jgi:hypothetical protein
MKQRRFVDWPGVQVLDSDGARTEQRFDARNGQGRGGNHLGTAGGPPDLDEMALARANRTGKQHGPRRPIGPAVDQGDRFGIGAAGEEVRPVERGPVRQ